MPITFGGHLQRELPILLKDSQVARGGLPTEPYCPEDADEKAASAKYQV